MPLVKLHKNHASVRPNNMVATASNYALSKGTLIYTHDRKGRIGAIFREHTDYGILNNTGAGSRYSVIFGNYEGRSEMFQMEYLHLRARFQAAMGSPTGNSAVDTAWGVAGKIGDWPGGLAEVLVPAKKKYFVAFRLDDGATNPVIMHNQKESVSTPWVYEDELTLGKIFHRFRGFFTDFV